MLVWSDPDSDTSTVYQMRRWPPFKLKPDFSTVQDCQVLRSVDHWSAGGLCEASILWGYMQAIVQSKYFIYIESQFFISDTATCSRSKSVVSNQVASVLIDRLRKAISNKEPFRVYILLPLYTEGSPAFISNQAVMYWQYRTISRDGKSSKSFFSVLEEEFPDVDLDHYITFYSLFQHGKINNKVVGSQIYIHSKLLIVDDQVLLIGSPNINDRSLTGHRDSEIAVKISNDIETDEVSFSGKPCTISKVIQSFRLSLWSEHLQIFPEDPDYEKLLDPTSKSCYMKLWRKTAKANTELLERLFPMEPCDSLQKLPEDPFHPHRVHSKFNNYPLDMNGHHILYPLHYLEELQEDLRSKVYDEMFQ